ncbi:MULTISPECIES: NYN domain-containing protein [unclassified Pseudoalteromonas]|uniref:LabA-like NYN domain-containing protein n=1 Tax=unclassified Pseudoalteromonas TaxID=194690 RepID=UPI001F37F1A1|nr:NYN domain-containing protein [Pseudoalteromonas sp. L1]WOC27586.1 NYN domain-containing protein [Pseudoalteromonas sp. N1230-9]
MQTIEKPRVAIFVDVQNIYYTCKESYGKNFDYNAFWAKMQELYTIDGAIAYAIYRGDEKQSQFQNILRAIGFEVKLKPFIQRRDGSAKGDWDVGITIDMLENARKVDKMVLLSGDGDFALLLGHLAHNYQIPCDVYGAEQLTADVLKNAAENFYCIDDGLLLNNRRE